MSTLRFVAEWAIRSSVLIGSGAFLLGLLRVKDSSIRLAAWTAILCGSLAIPALTLALPKTVLPTIWPPVRDVVVRLAEAPTVVYEAEVRPTPRREPGGPGSATDTPAAKPQPPAVHSPVNPPDWQRAALTLYALTCCAMLLRVCAGLVIGLRLLNRSRETGQRRGCIEIRESPSIGAPVTLGIVRPAIVLPGDWREWDGRKLKAVLAHEHSHIRRHDPALQLISAIHRALLWVSPLSWLLHQRIVRTAEEASDDAAVAETHDRACYAEILLDFMQRGVWNSGLTGVPMARYDSPEKRIRRILNSTALSRGVTGRSVAAIVALVSPLAYVAATAQPQSVAQVRPSIPPVPRASAPQAFQGNRSAVPKPTFDTADVHASGPNTILKMRSAFSRGRYELQNASLVELIQTAWNIDAANVVGGPEWIDKDRFDVTATAPGGATPEMLKAMLRTLLEDRFQLTVRKDTRSVPAYAMTVGKKHQLKASETSAGRESGCTIQAGTLREPVLFQCRNMTMAGFADDLSTRWPATDYLFHYRVVDRTGLKGAWDFSFECSRPLNGQPAPAVMTTLFDALEKQLGLKLQLAKIPIPVVAVDRAQRPVTEKAPSRPMEFEVATIKPDGPDARGSNVSIQPGGHVRIMMTLQDLIWEAWGNLNTERIVGGPKSMDTTHWVIEAKAPAQEDAQAGWNGPVWNGVDINSMRMMLRALLVDRFKLAAHMEDRLVSGYALVAVKPKLRPADASNRPGCKEGPGADGKDPRFANPLASRLVTCRGMTLAQFAAELSKPTSEENPIILNFPPVVDATRINGRYDMTINFTPPSAIRNSGGPTAGADAVASDPDGTISIFEALPKQLGLKLESRKVLGQVLVIDHVEEKPTEN